MSDRRYSGYGASSQNTSSYHENEPPPSRPSRPSSNRMAQAYPASASAVRVPSGSSMYNTLYSVSSSSNTTMNVGYYFPGPASGGLSVGGDNASQNPALSRYPTSTGEVYASQVAMTYNVPSRPHPQVDLHEAISPTYGGNRPSNVSDCHSSCPPVASFGTTRSVENNVLRPDYDWGTHQSYGIPHQTQTLPMMIGRTELTSRSLRTIDTRLPVTGGDISLMSDPERNTNVHTVQYVAGFFKTAWSAVTNVWQE